MKKFLMIILLFAGIKSFAADMTPVYAAIAQQYMVKPEQLVNRMDDEKQNENSVADLKQRFNVLKSYYKNADRAGKSEAKSQIEDLKYEASRNGNQKLVREITAFLK